MRTVVTNGCFDILHAGHVAYLQEARSLGDRLIVLLNTDNSVRALKGEGRPFTPYDQRKRILEALEAVSGVVSLTETSFGITVRAIRPAIYVKGGDYTLATLDPGEREVLESIEAEIRILPFATGISTSRIIERIVRRENRRSRDAAN